MNLEHNSFFKIKDGTKTVEMRLFDEKRSHISIGDMILFEDVENGNQMECLVTNLYRYPTFVDLYAHHDKISIGYDDKETADPDDMLYYYSKDNIKKYGVVGIEIRTV
ncbi:MAG: hypothetical protein NC091_00200 [Bacteroides sp.]|nr:hypothetical protein [Bacteroides sp.]